MRAVSYVVLGVLTAVSAAALELEWTELPPVPAAPGQDVQLGLAGVFAGVHNGALIVAGGANFPEAPPWKGGHKVWWDDVYVLEKGADGAYVWHTSEDFKLPQPLAYGVSVSTREGVICLGGCNADQCYRDVFVLKWNPVAKRITTARLPSMPHKLAFASGTLIGRTIYLAGGQVTMRRPLATSHFWALDLSQQGNRTGFKWQRLPSWPGPSRVLPVTVAQRRGDVESVYLFSGREAVPERPSRFLTDAYAYARGTLRWRPVAEIQPSEGEPRAVVAAVGAAVGNDRILIFGGDDGPLFLERERLERAIAQAKDPAKADALKAQLAQKFEKHEGFKDEILSYNTNTDTWSVAGRLPTTSHVTTAAVAWQGGVVIVSGEIRPGIRTPKVWLGTWSEE